MVQERDISSVPTYSHSALPHSFNLKKNDGNTGTIYQHWALKSDILSVCSSAKHNKQIFILKQKVKGVNLFYSYFTWRYIWTSLAFIIIIFSVLVSTILWNNKKNAISYFYFRDSLLDRWLLIQYKTTAPLHIYAQIV